MKSEDRADIFFSIIIPHYNCPHYLRRLLETTPYDKADVEIIVVDDRSDENLEELRELIREYKSKGILFYRNNNGRKGAGTCRNIGMKHAVGKWFVFADSDDFFSDDVYETIKSVVNSTADVVYFSPSSVEEGTGNISWRHEEDCKFINDYINMPNHENEVRLRFGIVGPVSKLYNKDFLYRYDIRFDEVTAANDILFSAKVGVYSKVIETHKENIYIISTRAGSMISTTDEKEIDVRTKENIKKYLFIKNNVSHDDLEILNISGTNRIIGMLYQALPMKIILKTVFLYTINGIKAVDFKKVTLYELISIMIKSRIGLEN